MNVITFIRYSIFFYRKYIEKQKKNVHDLIDFFGGD